jgi:ferredoxin
VTTVDPEIREVNTMRVSVDQNSCVGSGQCVLAAADIFDQREEDGIVVLLSDNPPEELVVDVRRAAAVCPARAITMDES